MRKRNQRKCQYRNIPLVCLTLVGRFFSSSSGVLGSGLFTKSMIDVLAVDVVLVDVVDVDVDSEEEFVE